MPMTETEFRKWLSIIFFEISCAYSLLIEPPKENPNERVFTAEQREIVARLDFQLADIVNYLGPYVNGTGGFRSERLEAMLRRPTRGLS